ncbi:MAG TPA: DUF2516 family protein [Micromonosporaceae bacterium]|nr:DUF2516 family protein [Micromonosporaceae bacterium]
MLFAVPPVFVITTIIDVVVFVATMVVGLWSFVHCLLQRSDAFPAIGTLPKGAWLAIIGVATALAGLTFTSFGILNIFGYIAVAAGCVYLLDVRPALREATGGGGSW